VVAGIEPNRRHGVYAESRNDLGGDPMEGPEQFAVRGVNGTLVVRPDRVIVRRKRAFLALLGQDGGTREIAIDQVSGIQFKKATRFVNGYIRFSLAGDVETKRSGFDAAQDADSVMFGIKQQPVFEKARELVDIYRRDVRRAASTE
jgi:hypothetical protein